MRCEVEVLAGLRFEKRRADWRLGRFASKAAVAIWLGVPPGRVEVAAAPDGAPEAWLDGRRAPASLSLSHRAGRALAVVGEADTALGCDLELVEPRSRAFLNDWLAPSERGLPAAAGARRDIVANLLWTAKEAAAQARREGLRLDVRQAVGELEGLSGGDARLAQARGRVGGRRRARRGLVASRARLGDGDRRRACARPAASARRLNDGSPVLER